MRRATPRGDQRHALARNTPLISLIAVFLGVSLLRLGRCVEDNVFTALGWSGTERRRTGGEAEGWAARVSAPWSGLGFAFSLCFSFIFVEVHLDVFVLFFPCFLILLCCVHCSCSRPLFCSFFITLIASLGLSFSV